MSATAPARPHRSKARARAVRAASNALSAVPPALQQKIAQQDISVRQQMFEPIGRLESAILNDKRVIEFRKQGPTLAVDSASELLLLDDWQGLPELRTLDPNTPCPDCLAACDECKGAGKRTCQLTFCGGSGRLHLAGVKKSKQPKCSRCHGTGKSQCDLCRGTGKMATGRAKGSTDINAPDCASCDGMKKLTKRIPQLAQTFSPGRIGPLTSLGPIACLVARRAGTREEGGGLQVIKILPGVDGVGAGQLAAILVEEGSDRAWLVGGRPQFTQTSVQHGRRF